VSQALVKACDWQISHTESGEAGRSANEIWDSEKLPHICCAKIVRENHLRERNMKCARKLCAKETSFLRERFARRNKTSKHAYILFLLTFQKTKFTRKNVYIHLK
jgi:hypothetical protein